MLPLWDAPRQQVIMSSKHPLLASVQAHNRLMNTRPVIDLTQDESDVEMLLSRNAKLRGNTVNYVSVEDAHGATELKSFIEAKQENTRASQNTSYRVPEIPAVVEQLCLLDSVNPNEVTQVTGLSDSDIKNAVLFSAEVPKQTDPSLLPQYGLLGQVLSASNFDARLFQNTNMPFSTFICGLQGSGKSHTLSCLLGKIQTYLNRYPLIPSQRIACCRALHLGTSRNLSLHWSSITAKTVLD